MLSFKILRVLKFLTVFTYFFQVTLSIRSLEDGSSAIPFLPTVVPLGVRSPYLGAYLSDGPDKDLTEMSPRFWTGSPLGWTGLIRVDGHVFNWMGNLTHWPAATNIKFLHTASSSNFTFAVGPSSVEQDGTKGSAKVYLHVSFLSPMTPSDLLRQSLPFSYISITVESADGMSHQVEVYTDINGLWCADHEELSVGWDAYSKDYDGSLGRPSWQTLSMSLRNQHRFQEESDRILQGAVWYSALNYDSDRVRQTYSLGEDANSTRTRFSQIGRLMNEINDSFRPIRTRSEKDPAQLIDEPILAYSHSFGFISPQRTLESRSALLSIGHVRNPAVQYMTTGEKVVELEPLWRSRFKSVIEMIEFHLFDYHHILSVSQAWDNQLISDAKRVQSQAYAEILAISARQIFMAIEAVTIDWNSTQPTSAVDESRVMLMVKEISSNGNCQTTDVIAPMLPFLVYSAPNMIPQLLEPIYRYVATGLYQPLPTPHDLGDHYPNATGRNDFIYANLPLEESGNILNLVLACIRLGTCKDQAQKYYHLLVQWADWLVENTLYPDDQRSTDDFFGPSPNQTSLVVKGILGLRSMSEISYSLGHTNDSTNYRGVATLYAQNFLELAIADDRTHIVGSYGNQSSWSTQYNLFFDKLYAFEVFPEWVYKMQDDWYLNQAIGGPFGPPLDSRSRNRAKTDWLMWAAAASTSNATRDMFVNALHSYVRQTENIVFGDLISLDGGWSVGFLDRPVVGGHFSLLALDTMTHHGVPSGHKLIFGTVDIDELIDTFNLQREKVLGYGRTAQGKGAIIVLGVLCLLFLFYRLMAKQKRWRKGSDERYQSVMGQDDSESGIFDSSSVRARSQSLLQSLKDHTTSLSMKNPTGKSLQTRLRGNDMDEEGLQIHLLRQSLDRGTGPFEISASDEEESEDDWDIGLSTQNENKREHLLEDSSALCKKNE